MKKSLVSFALVIITLFGLAVPALAASVSDFRDVSKGDWYYESVEYCVKNGYVSGTSSTSFTPGAKLERGQFITMLGRMEGVNISSVNITGKFTDVSSGAYYAPYVYWAYSNKIISGAGDNTFAPTSALTREQMAVIIVNYLKYKGIEFGTSSKAVSGFSDAYKISSYAVSSVEILRKCALVVGSGGMYDPQSSLTRAEGATVTMNVHEKMLNEAKLEEEEVEPTPQPGDWFTVKAESFSLALDNLDVSIYDYLTSSAAEKFNSSSYKCTIDSISNPSVLSVKYTYFVPLNTGTTEVTWKCTTPDGDTFYTSATVTVNPRRSAPSTSTFNYTVESNRFLQLCLSWEGYLEKKSRDYIYYEDFTANAGTNNWQRFSYYYDMAVYGKSPIKDGYAWCATFICANMIETYGLEEADRLMCKVISNQLGAGCTWIHQYFDYRGRYYTRLEGPKIGDLVIFEDDNHIGAVYKVDDNYVYTVEGNTSGGSDLVANGGGVACKKYSRTSSYIDGYCRPDYQY